MIRIPHTVSLALFVLFAVSSIRAQSPVAGAAERASAEADFAQLRRYSGADAAVKAAGEHPRVIFLGDSITDYWGTRNGTWFRHAGWLNRGIGGQTTSQLLLRLNDDVLSLHPQAVVIEGGGNDMRLAFSPAQIAKRIENIGELASLHGLQVFVLTMTPVCDCVRPLTGLRTVERIAELNTMLRELCKRHRWTLVDVNAPLADPSGRMKAELTVDGVHPNDRGYAAIQPALDAALKKYW